METTATEVRAVAAASQGTSGNGRKAAGDDVLLVAVHDIGAMHFAGDPEGERVGPLAANMPRRTKDPDSKRADLLLTVCRAEGHKRG